MPKKRERLLVLRGSTYHARLDVPKDVQSIIGKKVFGKSLKTGNLAEAKAALAYVIAEWRQLILDARGRLSNDGWKLEAYEAIQRIRAQASLERDTTFSYGPLMAAEFKRYVNEAFPAGVPEELKAEIEAERLPMLLSNSPPEVSFFSETVIKRFESHRLQEVEMTTAERDAGSMRALGKFLKAKGYGFDTQAVAVWLDSLNVVRQVKKSKIQSGKTFINYLMKSGLYPSRLDNPFEKVELPNERKKSASGGREPFTLKEVQILFSNAAVTDKLLAATIGIAAYTGMRAEEISQIRVQDVIDKSGDYFIKIHRASTKTDAGQRIVPIHRELMPLVKLLLERTTSDYLLDYKTESRIGKRSVLLVTRFSKMKRAMAFPPSKTFHSFRHTLVTQLERANIAENIAADIVGHAKTTMTYGLYSGGTDLKMRTEAINKIESYGLSFDGL